MTREERFEIYRKMLVIAERDLEYSQKRGYSLFSFCSIIEKIEWELSIECFPELMEYKPKSAKKYWFDTDPNGEDATKRIDILKEILGNE
jgi:hypothetical protein